MKPGLTSLCLVLPLGDAICSAQNWPQFRGEHGGVATDHVARLAGRRGR
jgi:hypothetical protein